MYLLEQNIEAVEESNSRMVLKSLSKLKMVYICDCIAKTLCVLSRVIYLAAPKADVLDKKFQYRRAGQVARMGGIRWDTRELKSAELTCTIVYDKNNELLGSSNSKGLL